MAAQPSGELSHDPREDVPAEKIPLDTFLPYLMNRLMGRLNQNLADGLRRKGSSFQHWRILLVLVLRGRRTIGDLVIDTMIPQSTLSRMVGRAERDGLIVRHPDDKDSRVVWLEITEEGRAQFDDLYPLAYAEYWRAVQFLSPEEEKVFLSLLRRMVEGACGAEKGA